MKDHTDHATQDILDATEKRGRKPLAAATPRETQAIEAALTSANQAVALLDERASRVRAVALQMGYQLPGDGVDADLIQRARQPMIEAHDNALKNNPSWLSLVDRAQTEQDRIDRYLRARDLLLALTAEQLQALAQRYLDPASAVEVLVLPNGVEAPKG